jgi:endoglucanase
MMDLHTTLQRLTETAGPSGLETAIADAVEDTWTPYVDSFERDRIGNLIAVKQGEEGVEKETRRPRLLLAAHMDEIALMVKKIVPSTEEEGYGFLRVTNVGGVDVRHLYGQRVVVHGERELPGIIGALPVRMLPDERQGKAYNYDELLVDVGLSLAELREQVSVGDFVTFHQPLLELANGRVAGKALDNRVSVAAVAVCLEYLSGRRHAWDVVAVATAQEETRLLGAFTSAYAQQPDAAIAIDVTFGKGPGAKDGTVFELGEGPTLGLGANVHPGIFKALKEAADALEMKVHTDPHARGSGTDAFGLQIAREGIPTGLVGIPLRYMHTMVETVALDDIRRTGRLLGEFVARLEADFLEQIATKMMEA